MPAARTIGDSFALGNVLDLCAFVEDLPRDAAGELSVVGRDGASDGAIFVERRRVCWAAARGLSRRLTDLLAASANLEPTEMELHYRRCSREHVPLGEHLVGSSLVSAPQLRAALLQHTSESLHALFGAPRRAQWNVRRTAGYSARFTFATSEVLAGVSAEDRPELARAARFELIASLDASDWGAAFVRSDARALPAPIAIAGTCPEGLDAILRLGRWACSALDVISVAHGESAFAATMLDDSALVAWENGTVVLAGRTSSHGPARLLNRRARARRKE